MKHREIKKAHEKAVLTSFNEFMNGSVGPTKLDWNPNDPPDAFGTINQQKAWAEISDAYINSDWAKSITSYAAEDKEHIPYSGGVMVNPDRRAGEIVKEIILKKYNKDSIHKVFLEHGPGILIVGAYTPLTFPEEIIDESGEEILASLCDLPRLFSSIYLYRNFENGHLFYKLL
tara:strand:+ start:59 stop:580 length:522 start_codon:yes stop_codon:yes gene_type:complete